MTRNKHKSLLQKSTSPERHSPKPCHEKFPQMSSQAKVTHQTRKQAPPMKTSMKKEENLVPKYFR